MPRLTPLEQFTNAYIDCMLWSTNDESDESGGVPLDQNYSVSDIAPDTLKRINADCAEFFATHGDNLLDNVRIAYRGDNYLERAGHDFWLTRNGHGCGFWDGDWLEPYATVLTEAAKACGPLDPCVAGGMIHI